MRRELAMTCLALASIGGATGCRQSEDNRVRLERMRARREAIVRETELVQRTATPPGPARIVYSPPPDLSEANLVRTHAPIVGLEKTPQASEPAQHSAPPAH
jgi:hypothetical protein